MRFPKAAWVAMSAVAGTASAQSAEKVHLYRMPVEIYWNDYFGQVLEPGPSPTVWITGEGKTAGFDGIVSLNCENGLYSWKTFEGFWHGWGGEEGDPPLPTQVMTVAFKKFC